MSCQHVDVVRRQRYACGVLEALALAWRADSHCPDCGQLVEVVWEAGWCAIWERQPTGIRFVRDEPAPAAEEPPADDWVLEWPEERNILASSRYHPA